MAATGIQDTRIQHLNDRPLVSGRYVLYWMQQSQRATLNHALEYAVRAANGAGQGIVVAFGLSADYPEANLRHFTFMLEGLKETARVLKRRGIPMVVRRGAPPDVALELGHDAGLIVCDRGYLKHQRAWREKVARQAACRVVQVESDVIVPVEAASPKAEIGARTLRPRIHRHLPDYLRRVSTVKVRKPALLPGVQGLDFEDPDSVLETLPIDRSVGPVSRHFKGGTAEAERLFADFLKSRLPRYNENHNQPQNEGASLMSPYLHFGQISPLHLVLRVLESKAPPAARDAFVEELVVRRELACNFVHYTPNYDAYGCIPGWARESLGEHRRDPRPHLYSVDQLEEAQTHDPYWNAAMREMLCTGYMHSHMRMYWGKKILEWSRTPQEGFDTTLALNNKYFLDGRDPNSYAGVAWIYGTHDRAWPERPVYGKVRCMTASGLERKCDIEAYVRKVDALCGRP